MGAPQYEQAGADIGGTGTTNTIPRWTGPSTLGDSGLIDDGTQVYTTTRKLAVGSASAVSELTAVTGAVAPTANPPALQTLHGNNQNVFRAKYTSTNFNVSGNWLGLGLGYHDNYMKAAIIAEAKDGTGRASMHIALNAATTAANVGLADARLTVTYDGNVGIGTASPFTRTESVSARATTLNSISLFDTMPLSVTDSTAFAVGVGGGINFRAKLSASGYSTYAALWSYRESASPVDYRGSLILATADNINGYPTERWRINSSGHFIAGADNTYDIGASGATRPRTVYVGTGVVGGYIRAGAASAGVASTTTIGNGTSTTATAGAQTLPANPLGFIIAHVGTTEVRIPYYAV